MEQKLSHPQEAQVGILSGMQIKAGGNGSSFKSAATPSPPASVSSPAPAALAPVLAPVVVSAPPPAKERKEPSPTKPAVKEEVKPAVVPDVIQIEMDLPDDLDDPVVGNLLDNRASLRQQQPATNAASALDTLVEVFDDESLVPLSRTSAVKTPIPVAATPAAPVTQVAISSADIQHQQKKETPSVRSSSPAGKATTEKPAASSTSSSSQTLKSPATRKNVVPVPRDAVSLEKEMRDLTDEVEAGLAQIARELEKDRASQTQLLREKIEIQKSLLSLNSELVETRASLAEAEKGENYQMAASLDADLQAVMNKLFAKEKRAREIIEALDQARRESAVLKSKEISTRRKGLLKLIELQRRREEFAQHCAKEREEYARERDQHISRRAAQLDKTQSGLQSDTQMLTENRDSIRGIVEKATGGLRAERETLRERLGEVERDIRELERQLREKTKIRAQVAEKIAKIDSSVRDVRARYDGELGEMEAQLRDKELRVAELDVERSALERLKRECKDNLSAFDSRINQQKEGLIALAGVVRKIEAEIGRGERVSAGRERDRDALLEIEQSMQDEGEMARESRVRLEEYDVEIRESQKLVDAIAVQLAAKKAEEEDLRLNKSVRAEHDKKIAAQERNYKEAQRLRDEVAKMKARCVELEGEIAELNTQQKEHLQRMESCQKASELEREKARSMQLETDATRLGAIERKLRLLLSIKLRLNKELRDSAKEVEEVVAAEHERKQLMGDLALVELQIEDSLSECVVLAERCGQPERVEEIRQIIGEEESKRHDLPAPSPRKPPAIVAVSPVPVRVAEPVAEESPEVEEEEQHQEDEAEKDEKGEEKVEVDKVALEAKLKETTTLWEAALEEDNYEEAERLDAEMQTIKAKLAQ
jgi:predicted regulator of amino acid metabolism with ACT domain